MNIIIILIILVIIGISIYVMIKPKTKTNTSWQVDYLKTVYPLSKDKISTNGPVFFDDLEFFFTFLLPDDIRTTWKETSFKASIPGPSCEQLPCSCITYKDQIMPNVHFDPDSLWDNQWPICNINDKTCCKNVESYLDCLIEYAENGQRIWSNYDTWNGIETADPYNIPDYNQVWKPTLFPLYTAVKSKYPKNNWENFYNIDGDDSNSWIEVTHTYFNDDTNSAMWLYKTKGSGIWLNLGRTFVAKNKIDALVKIFGLDNIVNEKFFDTPLNFWLGNGVKTKLVDFLNTKQNIPGENLIDKTKNTFKYIIDPKEGEKVGLSRQDLYDLNRIANTGDLDSSILVGIFQLEVDEKNAYRTIQFTAQPNLYPGWTTEIIYKGDNIGNSLGGYLKKIDKKNLRILDVTDLTSDTSEPCLFNTTRNLYCDDLIHTWLDDRLGSRLNVDDWKDCANV